MSPLEHAPGRVIQPDEPPATRGLHLRRLYLSVGTVLVCAWVGLGAALLGTIELPAPPPASGASPRAPVTRAAVLSALERALAAELEAELRGAQK